MKKFFESYGGVIVTVIAVVALITLVTVLTNENGGVNTAFKTVIQEFSDKASGMIEQSVGGSGGSGGTPAPQPPVSVETNPIFADNTWAEIAAACKANQVPATWNVGDTKEMEINGQSYTVAIIGKNHDTYVDGGTAPLTFQVIDLVTNYNMNSGDTNRGGWPVC